MVPSPPSERFELRIVYTCLQPRGSGDASDTHVDGLVAGLRRRGHTVDLIEFNDPNASLVRRVWVAVLVQIRARKRFRTADLVWLRMHPVGVLIFLLARKPRIVVEVNGVAEDFFVAHPGLRRVARALRWALRYQIRRADHVFAVTEGLAERCREAAAKPERVVVLPNGVDTDLFRPDVERPPGLPPRYVIFFGALARWQGIDLALEATADPSWPFDVRLVILGDGAERDRVDAAVARGGGRVQYLGAVPPAAVPGYVAHALGSLVLKRYHDAYAGQSPLKFYESLAVGVPVIATRMSGMTDVSLLQSAVVAVDATPTAVARGVGQLAQDRARDAMGASARRAILAAHTWDHRVALAETALAPPSDPTDDLRRSSGPRVPPGSPE
jgi:glycosyltransferase involved in cell wall biosynthesis